MNANANFVVYRRDPYGDPKEAKFNRFPLFSCEVGAKNAAVKIGAHMQIAYQQAINTGNPLPDLDVVREEREANEAGQQSAARFWIVDPLTLEAARDAKPANTLLELA